MFVDLSGKVIAVTGAFGSLGAAVARMAFQSGARVAMLDRADASKAPLDLKDAIAIGGVDLTSSAGAHEAITQVVSQFGRLDALVNVAGGFRWEKIEGGSIETWDFLYQMNLRTAVNTSNAALPHLIASGNGCIVNIGALAANKAGTGMGAYAASKAGIAKLTEALAEELKDRNVTVNAVLPSIIDTVPNRNDMPQADFSKWVKPEQIAELIVFLVSDHARAITGALIPIAGKM